MNILKMRRRDIIDIICEFEIIHDKNLENYGEIDLDERKIYIRPQMPDDKRDTIIHELIHAHNYLNMKDEVEKEVYKKAKKLYKQIYRK